MSRPTKLLSRQPGWKRLIAICVMMIVLPYGIALAQQAASGGSSPQQSASDPKNAEAVRAELEAIQSSITLSRERTEALKAEIAEMDGDRARQNAALIAAAQRVKLAEIEVGAVEERLAGLIDTEKQIRDRLDGADRNVANLLAALQRITRAPPPVLLVDPDDAADSARSAILLASVLPQLRARAGSVAEDLERLLAVRQSAQEEEETLRANLATLFEEQLRTATLIEARKRGVAVMTGQLAAEENEAQELAARARSLEELIDDLSENIDSVPAASATQEDRSWVNLDRQTILTALADTTRREPAIPFPAARGFLTMPASGVITSQFGSDDGLGGIAKGISVVTRADAQVVAPADGWVMYKGPYLNYGQIIILNPGQGYSILLAGLEQTNVELGQFVMMGEPVGTMGSRTVGQAVTTSAGVSRPTLYIELREQNTPLNPLTWWARKDNQTQSG